MPLHSPFLYPKTAELKLEENVVLKFSKNEFKILDDEKIIGEIPDKIEINYIKDVNWDDILK